MPVSCDERVSIKGPEFLYIFNLGGTLTEGITLSVDGRSFDSTIGLELFDTSGKPVAGGGQATGQATRTGL